MNKKYDDDYTYSLFEDGYDIFYKGNRIITQRDPFGKIFDRSKSYEENCLIQLDQMTRPPEPVIDQVAINTANIDYIAMMTDVELPEVVPQ